jgi:hypothetical protein
MIRACLVDGTYFSIADKDYSNAIAALRPDANPIVELALFSGGSVSIKTSMLTAVTQQTEEDLVAAWKDEGIMDRRRDDARMDNTQPWE